MVHEREAGAMQKFGGQYKGTFTGRIFHELKSAWKPQLKSTWNLVVDFIMYMRI